MEEVQVLGGNIQLVGFSQLDGGSMIILKKIVGGFVREFAEQVPAFEQFSLKLNKMIRTPTGEGNTFVLESSIKFSGQEAKTEAESANLFLALDKALRDVRSKITL